MLPFRTPSSLRSLALLSAPLAGLLFLACGGKSSDPAPTPVTTVPEGFWKGSMTSLDGRTSVEAVAMVLADGEARVVTGDGFQFSTQLSQGTGTGMAYAMAGHAFPSGASTLPATVQVLAVTPKTSFSGKIQARGESVAYSFPTYVGGYDQPLTLATLAGTYASPADANTGAMALTITVDANGKILGTGAGGATVTGEASIPDPAKSALRLDLTVTGPTASPSVTTFSGLGIYTASPTAGFFAAVTGPTTLPGFVAAFVKQ